jgi:diguanylate cyclase (GGDEF)-like protein
VSVSSLHFEPSFKSLVDEFSKPIAVFDHQLNLIYFNRQYESVFGSSVKTLSELIEPDRFLTPANLVHHIARNGSWRGQVHSHVEDAANYQIKLVQLADTDKPRFVAVIDAQRLRLVRAPSQRTLIDDLTELPNRYAFHNSLQERITSADGSPEFAVIYIDLDHFKDINELHGHEIGDGLLKLCAEKIRQLLRKDDQLARLSGDEFAAIVGCGESFEMQFLCHRIMRYFERPVLMNGKNYQFTVSIGVVFYPEQGDTPQNLIINAEKAMFAAKKQGRAQFQMFDRKQSKKVEQQQRLVEELRRALSETPEQFSAAYQPLYHIQTREFIGMEVLARWESSEMGQISPSEFIPLAESRGLINMLTARVFDIVRQDITALEQKPGSKRPLLAVNVCAQQILDSAFEHMLLDFFADVSSAGWQLEVELTESQLMAHTDELIDQLESWRTRGIRIAIDDFGTGYSCLAYLHMLPVDKLKIDRQFLRAQTHSRKEDQIMYAIISMANALGIEVLAEGIETKEQFNRLQELGCSGGQGFGLARPQKWDPKLLAPLD